MILFGLTSTEQDQISQSEKLDGLLQAVAQGGKEELGRLYHETSKAVFGFALSILKNTQDAEDILQEVYIRIWQSATQYSSRQKPMAWILTITRNLCLSRFKQNGKTLNMTPEQWETVAEDNSMFSVEDGLVLSTMLSHLNDDDRQIVVLHAVGGLKHREIAAMLDIPSSTVLSKYSRSLKKLKTLLGED